MMHTGSLPALRCTSLHLKAGGMPPHAPKTTTSRSQVWLDHSYRPLVWQRANSRTKHLVWQNQTARSNHRRSQVWLAQASQPQVWQNQSLYVKLFHIIRSKDCHGSNEPRNDVCDKTTKFWRDIRVTKKYAHKHKNRP